MEQITEEYLIDMHSYWQAANYLSAGQIYLQNNPLLKAPLAAGDIKPRLLGHWGTSPGLNLIYVHLNRLIKSTNADVLYICGPGHRAPAILWQASSLQQDKRYPKRLRNLAGAGSLLFFFNPSYFMGDL